MRRRVSVFLAVAILLLMQVCILSGYAVVALRTEMLKAGDAHASDILSPFLEFGRSIDRWTSSWYGAEAPRKSLPSYTLTVDDDQWKRLQESLPKHGEPFEDALVPWVPATFTAEGQPMDVHVRVYGKTSADWMRPKKSWEVRFDDARAFHGMRHLLFLLPEEHGWLQDLLLQRRSKRWGLLYPESAFVSLMINGTGPMVYLRQEGWTEEMAQRQGRGAELALYQISSTRGGVLPASGDSAYWKRLGDEGSRVPDDTLAALLRLAEAGAENDPEYLASLSNVLDMDRLIALLALRLSMGNPVASDDALRLLFRGDKGIFEPVMLHMPMMSKRSILAPSGIPLIDVASRVPVIRSKALSLLAESLAHDQRDDAAFLADIRRDIEVPLYADRWKLPSNRMVRLALDRSMAIFRSNHDDLQSQMGSAEVLIREWRPAEEGEMLLTLDINARGPITAVLSTITLPERYRTQGASGLLSLVRDTGNGVYGPEDISVPLTFTGSTLMIDRGDAALLWPGNPAVGLDGELLRPPHRRHRFFLVGTSDVRPLTIDALPLPVSVRNAVTGGTGTILATVFIDDRVVAEAKVPSMGRKEFLARFPMFSAHGGSGVILKGTVTITKTIVIPPHLPVTVAPGTRMAMGSGASVISYSPLTMIGTTEAPISITPERRGGSWGTWALVDVAEPSDLHVVRVEGGQGLSYGGRNFLGSVTFMDSPGSLTDVEISGARGKAALALTQLSTEVRDTTVQDASGRGIVVTSALAGRIERTSVKGSQDHAIDLRGSSIVLRDINVQDSSGACIHVAERSAPLLERGTLERCAMGISTDDGGHIVARGVTLLGNAVGLHSGGGTASFGPGSIIASAMVFIDNGERVREGSGGIISVE